MKKSVHVNSSSTRNNPTVPPMFVKSDENDQNYPLSTANLNRSKLGETEIVVKSKVLTDRNEVVDLKSSEEDSETKSPYDPLTNYLSPRPRFLRYKPNRRREILRRVGEEVCEIDSLSVSRSSSSEEGEEEEETEMKEMEKVEMESEAKFMEIYEDEGDVNSCWTVKDLLKILLVIVSLVLCTEYITSMNAPTPSFEVLGAFGSGFCPILNNTGEFGSSKVVESINENGSHFWDEEVTKSATNMNDDEGVSQFDDHYEDEINLGFVKETELLNGENEGVDLVKLKGETIDEEKVEDEENGVEFSELTAKDDGHNLPNQKEFEISDTIAEEVGDQQHRENLLSDISTVAGNEYASQMEVVEKEEAGEWEMPESNTGEPESSAVEAGEIAILDRIINELLSFVEDLKSVLMELIMHTETKTVLKAVFGLSLSSTILTCLISSFQFKKKKNDKKEAAISVSVVERSNKTEEFITKEEKPFKNNEPIKNVKYPSEMLSSSIHSRDELESFKVMYHHEAPTVQFLSEFVVNDIGNSLKNKSGFNNRSIEEAEDSNFPISVEENPVSKHMNSGPEQATSEFSTTSSPSYGSFTTRKKIVKKEVGGEEVVIPTPVRRSSRIRNRIVSP